MPQNHETASVWRETWHTRPPRHEKLVGEDGTPIGFPVWEFRARFHSRQTSSLRNLNSMY